MAFLGSATLIPTVIVLRRIVDRYLYAVLDGLVLFYFIDRLRLVFAALPTLSRGVFLFETLGGISFIIWLLHPRRAAEVPDAVRGRLGNPLRMGAWAALGILLMAFLSNALGFVGLGNLLGNAVLRSAYLGVTLYAFLRILDLYLMIFLRLGPLSHLGWSGNTGRSFGSVRAGSSSERPCSCGFSPPLKCWDCELLYT